MVKDLITSTILEGERDASGYVHDGVEDHPGTAILTSGYNYHTIEDLYTVLYGSDLVGWWPLNEDSGDARDLSGNGNHGTVNGATQGVGGRGGLQAYSFDGSSGDHVDVGSNIFGNTELQSGTISAWVYSRTLASSTGRARPISFENGALSIIFRTDDTVDLQLRDDTNTTRVLNAGSHTTGWDHFVFTWNGSLIGYRNGSQVDSISGDFTPRLDTSSATWLIGDYDNNFGEVLDGLVCDVRLYDTNLSSSQVQTLYEWGSGDYAIPPDNNDDGVSYYDFNSANANDQWGTNDGTVNGATHVASGGPREDGAYSFDGTDDYITMNNTLGSSEWTTTFWFNADNASTSRIIDQITSNDGYMVRINSGPSLEAFIRDSGGSNNSISTSFSTDVWNFGTVTYDGSTHKLYLNGVVENSQATTYSVATGTFELGRDTTGNDEYVSCDIDEVRIYDRALEPWEIQELYQYGTLGRSLLEHTVNV